MNERLKQHIESNFKDWDKNSHGALFDEEGYLVSLERIKTECKYFYRLALEDVRHEVEKRVKFFEDRKEGHPVLYDKLEEVRSILSFIDQLSK